MTLSTSTYDGGLRCSAVHGPSGITIHTDAPVDNQGRGEVLTGDEAARVLEMLKARIQKDPNDMIARRIYMQAATMIDPASAKAMADETQQIPNLPVSLEALVQEETRVAAVTSLFNAQFEEWRAAKDLESKNALLPKLQAVRDNAVKMLQPIGERGQAQARAGAHHLCRALSPGNLQHENHHFLPVRLAGSRAGHGPGPRRWRWRHRLGQGA
jgi:hypothetical protein